SGKTLEDTTKRVDAQATTENAIEESSKKPENQQQPRSAAAEKPEKSAARKETNIPFPQQIRKEEIQNIVQENGLDEVQADSATHMQPLVEEIQLRKDIVQPHEDNNIQHKIEKERQQDNLLQQNIQEGMQ
ncbi:hypothetical protein PIB30_109197, partial [Stylosanthes scabra]|nr:hypothetical protein [Stylosanthes scabra]